MQAQHYALASPPIRYTNYSQASDQYSDCPSAATLASTLSSQSSQNSAISLVWSAASSQESDFTAPSSSQESDCYGDAQDASQQRRFVAGQPSLEFHETQYQPPQACEVPSELRRNPRRTSAATSAVRGCPPKLCRQVDRKVEFVDKLVDSATYIVEAIWPTSLVPCRPGFGASTSVLPLRKFIEETLRRSRTSYSTLQVGLYYLILIKPHIPAQDFTMEQTDESYGRRALQCGRRMFLAALILASKWLQDRNYSARAWSKISGLKISEINENEIAFLAAVNWKLHVPEKLYNTWSDCVMKHTPSLPPTPPGGVVGPDMMVYECECAAFKELIRGLTPELDNIGDLVPKRRPQIRSSLSVRSLVHPWVEEPYPAASWSVGQLQQELSPEAMLSPSRVLPTLPELGLLPTPRLTPRPPLSQTRGFSTPAVSAASQLLGGGRACSMSSALSSSFANQTLERWQIPRTTSPQSYVPTRRSSLANTVVSTASSPESMVSDSSVQSRTSSVSSVSLAHNAPAYMQARRAGGERQRLVYGAQYQAAVAAAAVPVPSLVVDETNKRMQLAVADLVDFPVEPCVVDALAPEAAYDSGCHQQLSDRDAAYALQELHNHRDADAQTPKAPKRKWTPEADDVQEHVRVLLAADGGSQLPDSPPYDQDTTPCADDYFGSKRTRVVAPDSCRPRFLEATFGQRHLVSTA